MSTYSYCSKCGTKHEKTASLNFCNSCGNPFNTSIASAAIPKKILPKRYMQAEDNEEDEIEEIPQLEKLDVELGQRRGKLTIRDFADGHVAEGFIRDKVKTPSRKKFLEEWQRIAGPRQKGESTEVGGGN